MHTRHLTNYFVLQSILCSPLFSAFLCFWVDLPSSSSRAGRLRRVKARGQGEPWSVSTVTMIFDARKRRRQGLALFVSKFRKSALTCGARWILVETLSLLFCTVYRNVSPL